MGGIEVEGVTRVGPHKPRRWPLQERKRPAEPLACGKERSLVGPGHPLPSSEAHAIDKLTPKAEAGTVFTLLA